MLYEEKCCSAKSDVHEETALSAESIATAREKAQEERHGMAKMPRELAREPKPRSFRLSWRTKWNPQSVGLQERMSQADAGDHQIQVRPSVVNKKVDKSILAEQDSDIQKSDLTALQIWADGYRPPLTASNVFCSGLASHKRKCSDFTSKLRITLVLFRMLTMPLINASELRMLIMPLTNAPILKRLK